MHVHTVSSSFSASLFSTAQTSNIHFFLNFIPFSSLCFLFSSSPDLDPLPLSLVPSPWFPLSVSGVDRVSSG